MFREQYSNLDCFSTCFENALQYHDVSITKAITDRLAVFNDGAQDCSLQAAASPAHKNDWDRSLRKFISEFDCVSRYLHAIDVTSRTIVPSPEPWALELYNQDIRLFLGSNPIVNSQVITNSISEGDLAICDVHIESHQGNFCKHAVLIVNIDEGHLYIYDPFFRYSKKFLDGLNFTPSLIENSNLKVLKDYFFKADLFGILKPYSDATDGFYDSFLIIRKK